MSNKIPKFVSITSTNLEDVITGMLISVVYALDEDGSVWYKIGFQKNFIKLRGFDYNQE